MSPDANQKKQTGGARKCKGDVFPWGDDATIANVRLCTPANRALILGRVAERLTWEELAQRLRVKKPETAKRQFRKAVYELEKIIEWKGQKPKEEKPREDLTLETEGAEIPARSVL